MAGAGLAGDVVLVAARGAELHPVAGQLALEARRNPDLRRALRKRLEQHLAPVEALARETAERDDEDISTPEKFRRYVEEWFSTPDTTTCSAILRGLKGADQ